MSRCKGCLEIQMPNSSLKVVYVGKRVVRIAMINTQTSLLEWDECPFVMRSHLHASYSKKAKVTSIPDHAFQFIALTTEDKLAILLKGKTLIHLFKFDGTLLTLGENLGETQVLLHCNGYSVYITKGSRTTDIYVYSYADFFSKTITPKKYRLQFRLDDRDIPETLKIWHNAYERGCIIVAASECDRRSANVTIFTDTVTYRHQARSDIQVFSPDIHSAATRKHVFTIETEGIPHLHIQDPLETLFIIVIFVESETNNLRLYINTIAIPLENITLSPGEFERLVVTVREMLVPSDPQQLKTVLLLLSDIFWYPNIFDSFAKAVAEAVTRSLRTLPLPSTFRLIIDSWVPTPANRWQKRRKLSASDDDSENEVLQDAWLLASRWALVRESFEALVDVASAGSLRNFCATWSRAPEDDFRGGHLAHIAQKLAGFEYHGSTICRFTKIIIEWSEWLSSSGNTVVIMPDPTELLDIFKTREVVGLHPNAYLGRAFPIDAAKLQELSTKCAEALCYCWGRMDILLNKQIWEMNTSTLKPKFPGSLGCENQSTINPTPCPWEKLDCLGRSSTASKLKYLWNLSTPRPLTLDAGDSKMLQGVQDDITLSLSSIFGSAINTIGFAGRCAISDIGFADSGLPELSWKRKVVSMSRPHHHQNLVNESDSPAVAGEQDPRDGEVSSRMHNEDGKIIELGWGNRGPADNLAYWADFYLGLKAALWVPDPKDVVGLGKVSMGFSKNSGEIQEHPATGSENLNGVLKWLNEKLENRLQREQRDLLVNQVSMMAFQRVGTASTSVSRFSSTGMSPRLTLTVDTTAVAGLSTIDFPTGTDTPRAPLPATNAEASIAGESADRSLVGRPNSESVVQLWRGLRRAMFWAGALFGLGLQGHLNQDVEVESEALLDKIIPDLVQKSLYSTSAGSLQVMPSSVQMAVENLAQESHYDREKLAVHHAALYLSVLFGIMVSVVSNNSSFGRKDLLTRMLDTMYKERSETPQLPRKLDSYYFLLAAGLCEDSSTASWLCHRGLVEFELLTKRGYWNDICSDPLTYAGENPASVNEEQFVHRRALVVGSAIGLSSQKCGNVALRESVRTKVSALILKYPVDEPSSRIHEIHCLATKVFGAEGRYWQDAEWGASLALGLTFFNTGDAKLLDELSLNSDIRALRDITPQALSCRLLCAALVLWDRMDEGFDWLMELVPVSLVLFNHTICCGVEENLREVFELLHPVSPIETWAFESGYKVDSLECPEELLPFRWYQLHVTMVSVVAWIQGLYHGGAKIERSQMFCLNALDWLSCLPLVADLINGPFERNRNESALMLLCSQLWHTWINRQRRETDAPEGDRSELFTCAGFFGVEAVVLRMATMFGVAAAGLLHCGSNDLRAVEAINNWFSKDFGDNYISTPPEGREEIGLSSGAASAYAMHQICHWAIGMVTAGEGHKSLNRLKLGDEVLGVLFEILATLPSLSVSSILDNRPGPQFFRFLIVPLLEDRTLRVVESSWCGSGSVQLREPRNYGAMALWSRIGDDWHCMKPFQMDGDAAVGVLRSEEMRAMRVDVESTSAAVLWEDDLKMVRRMGLLILAAP